MRTITKINSDKFVQRMNNELVKLGAIKVDNTLLQSHFYELPTRGGKLYVRVDEENKYCFTVFTRFEDVEKAKTLNLRRMNEHSGKFNFHLGYLQPKQAIDEILYDLKKLV